MPDRSTALQDANPSRALVPVEGSSHRDLDTSTARANAVSFDYAALPTAQAEVLRQHAATIRHHTQLTVASMVEIGRELCAVKKILGHGRFIAWLRSECGFPLRTAQNRMKAAKLVDKYASLALLPLGVLESISRPGTPAALRKAVLAAAMDGAPLSEAGFVRMRRDFRRKPAAGRTERATRNSIPHAQNHSDQPAFENVIRQTPAQLEQLEFHAAFIRRDSGDYSCRLLVMLYESGELLPTIRALDAILAREETAPSEAPSHDNQYEE